MNDSVPTLTRRYCNNTSKATTARRHNITTAVHSSHSSICLSRNIRSYQRRSRAAHMNLIEEPSRDLSADIEVYSISSMEPHLHPPPQTGADRGTKVRRGDKNAKYYNLNSKPYMHNIIRVCHMCVCVCIIQMLALSSR